MTLEVNPEAFKGNEGGGETSTSTSSCVDQAWEAIGKDFGFPEGEPIENFCNIVKHIDNNLQGRYQELAKRVVHAKNMSSETCESDYENEWNDLLTQSQSHEDGPEAYFQGYLHGFVEQMFGNGRDVQSCYDNTEEK